jgi:hypothetical protein
LIATKTLDAPPKVAAILALASRNNLGGSIVGLGDATQFATYASFTQALD